MIQSTHCIDNGIESKLNDQRTRDIHVCIGGKFKMIKRTLNIDIV